MTATPEDIESQIDGTREALKQTLDALEARTLAAQAAARGSRFAPPTG